VINEVVDGSPNALHTTPPFRAHATPKVAEAQEKTGLESAFLALGGGYVRKAKAFAV
jgi:hypothetical protein